jgi:hypothetical protein
MSKLILNEGFLDAVSRRWNTAWGTLKGRFWQSVRLWINIYEIWQTKSQEELDNVITQGREDIDRIKTRYRSFEEQYSKDNGVFNSTFGNTLLFTNPAAALGYGIYQKFIRDEAYKSDVKRVLIDSGFGNKKLFPRLSKYLHDSRSEDPSARIESTDPSTGERTESIIYQYKSSSENEAAKKAMESIGIISKIFGSTPTVAEPVSESRIHEVKEKKKESNKEQAKRVTAELLAILKEYGVIEEIEKIGSEILDVKQAQYQQMIIPAAATIEKMTKIAVSETPQEFKKLMSELSSMNKQLKDLSAGEFEKQIDGSIEQVKRNEKLMDQLRKDYKKDDILDEDIKNIVFIQVRDEFTKNIVNYLEEFYEGLRSLVMDGVTSKGLKKMEKSSVGKEYSESVNQNIQLLDNAIKSLKALATQQGEEK